MADVNPQQAINQDTPTPEQLAEMGLLTGTAEEVAEINAALDAPIGDGIPVPGDFQAEPAPTPTPTSTPTPVPAVTTVEIDGVQVPLAEAADAYKNMKAWRRENDARSRAVALERQEMNAKFESLANALKGVSDKVDERIPAPPPPPLKIDLSDIGPEPDQSTIEGMEAHPAWLEKALAKAAEAGARLAAERRGINGRTTPSPAPTPEPTPAVPAGVDPVVWEHNQTLRSDFLGAENLSALRITPEKAQAVLEWIEESGGVVPTGPIGPRGRFYQMSDLHRAAQAYEAHMNPPVVPANTPPVNVRDQIGAARDASNVLRPGEGAPAQTPQQGPTLRRITENPDLIQNLTPAQKYALLRQGALLGLPGFVQSER